VLLSQNQTKKTTSTMVSAGATTAAIVAMTGPFMASSFSITQTQHQIATRSSTALGVSYLESLSEKPGNVVPTQYQNYLDSLSTEQPRSSSVTTSSTPAAVAESTSPPSGSTGFCHAPFEYFHFDNLSSKGPRATFDWGTPQDWSRKLADDGVFRAGSWYCSEGGWESPNGKAVTEVFYVLYGHGCLGDSDGNKHYFGPGDTVIIPKGHTGRWDVNTPIHKVWAVNAHSNVEETGPVIPVKVFYYKDFSPDCLTDTSAKDPLYGNTGSVPSASNTYYDVGPTKVGAWTCEPGTFEVANGVRQWFHMLEGTMFITDSSNGISKRCVAGDTIMLPAGWSGYVDVIEPVKKVFTVAL
jgi:uncharacterized cupin superfamily protein